jgi:hypothetical protein
LAVEQDTAGAYSRPMNDRFAGTSPCTSKYLSQAGVPNTFMRLENERVHGNGHMVMLEKNNLVVAALLHKWVAARVK